MPFHDYADSVVVHSLGGWFALPAVLLLGPRMKRYTYYGDSAPIKVSSIPFLALGSWILCVGSDLYHPIGALVVGGVAGAILCLVINGLQNACGLMMF